MLAVIHIVDVVAAMANVTVLTRMACDCADGAGGVEGTGVAATLEAFFLLGSSFC